MNTTSKITLIVSFLCSILACDHGDTTKTQHTQSEKGWIPVDSNLIHDESLPEITEVKPKADSILADFLPTKIYDYRGDAEVQNSDNTTNMGTTIKSVVRVYRNNESVIGINVSDYSAIALKERKDIFAYHEKTLQQLSTKKETVFKNLSIAPDIKGKLLFSKTMNKAIIILNINDEMLININTDTRLSIEKLTEITKQIDFKKLKQIKQIS